MSEPKIVMIDRPFITLGQLLKEEDIIPSGGAAKWFLAENTVQINGEVDQRRGKKLYPDDVVDIQTVGQFKIATPK